MGLVHLGESLILAVHPHWEFSVTSIFTVLVQLPKKILQPIWTVSTDKLICCTGKVLLGTMHSLVQICKWSVYSLYFVKFSIVYKKFSTPWHRHLWSAAVGSLLLAMLPLVSMTKRCLAHDSKINFNKQEIGIRKDVISLTFALGISRYDVFLFAPQHNDRAIWLLTQHKATEVNVII